MFAKELARLAEIKKEMVELQRRNDAAQSISHEDCTTRRLLIGEHWKLDNEQHRIKVFMANESARMRTMEVLNRIPKMDSVHCQCHNEGHIYKEDK
jgi:hypothetical protein